MNIGTIRLFHLLTITLTVTLLYGCAPPPIVERADLVFPEPPNAPRFYFEQSIRSNLDIEGESEDERMTRYLTGAGKQGTGFRKPFDVAVHQGRVFVSDTAGRAVYMLDKSKGLFETIGEDSPEQLAKPMGMDIDGNGNLYVIDASTKKLQVYNRDGNYLKTIEKKDLFSRPSSVAVNREGTRAFIVDVGGVGSDQHKIQVFDIQSGDHIDTISERGKEPGLLNLPKDAVIGNDGLLYIVDSGNFRISAFQQDGTYVKSFGKIGLQFGNFSRPKGISVDPDGNIYVVDAGFGNFQIFNTDGQLLMFIGSRNSRGDRAEYMLPAGIDVDEDGRIYVVDQYHKKLEVYRPAHLKPGQGYFGSKQNIDAPVK